MTRVHRRFGRQVHGGAHALRSEFGTPAGTGLPAPVALELLRLGDIGRCQGDDERARTRYEEALAWGREVGADSTVAEALYGLDYLTRQHDDLDRAAALWKECLSHHRDGGRQRYVAWCLIALGGLVVSNGQQRSRRKMERAARLFGAAAALADNARARMLPPDRADYDVRVATARTILGETVFATACTTGRAMTLEQAVAEALDDVDDS